MSDHESKLIEKITNALERDAYEVPYNFADKVMRKIEQKENSISTDHLWLIVGIASFVIASVAAGLYFKLKLNFGAFKFVSGYPGLILFASALVLSFHLLDKKLRKGLTRQ